MLKMIFLANALTGAKTFSTNHLADTKKTKQLLQPRTTHNLNNHARKLLVLTGHFMLSDQLGSVWIYSTSPIVHTGLLLLAISTQ